MLLRLAQLVTHRWMLIVAIWLAAVVIIRWAAPRWENITHDGDFAYLPAEMPSVVGQQWMAEAFPRQRGRSQIAVAVIRHNSPMTKRDVYVAYDVARRLKNLLGATRVDQARELKARAAKLATEGKHGLAEKAREEFQDMAQKADKALADALSLDEQIVAHWSERIEEAPEAAASEPPRVAEIYHNRALLNSLRGQTERALKNRTLAGKLNPDLAGAGDHVLPEGSADLPLVDLWTWQEDFFGGKLISRDHCVRLVVLQLTSEFMAVENIKVVEQIEAELAPVRNHLQDWTRPGLSIVQSGSAAVGADLLRTAASSIRHTELFTIVLVVLILALVYRSPLLVILPVVTILVSLLVSTGLVALLTQLSDMPGFGWWSLKVFSTTKIFIIVILFGAGTDYCLFLIARYKEELRSHGKTGQGGCCPRRPGSGDRVLFPVAKTGLAHRQAVVAALTNVGDALVASALTTVLGLSMMFFAEFGKFHYSGPVIGLCLAVTLLACTTLTPAIMSGLGPILFWPFSMETEPSGDRKDQPNSTRPDNHRPPGSRIWRAVARALVKRPGLIFVVCLLTLSPLATYGVANGRRVTYDFLSGLPPTCPGKQGVEALRPHFPVGESGPITVLMKKENARFQSTEGRGQIRHLSDQLHLKGVQTVRSVEDPLGDYAPGETPGILSSRGRRLRMLRAHPRTKAIFVAQTPELAGEVVRLEVILKHNPFSLEAIRTVDRIEAKLKELSHSAETYWSGAEYALTGTTAGIRELRSVTRRDNIRIQVLVVVAVLAVLLAILRRPILCLYLMVTVLFSYYITMGITTLFFSTAYGTSYQGLDWKVPLFLFVILVAVGQDYNVYLTTRVLEEQRRLGPFAGLRRAVVRTGGIITSCGIIMAGTFFSMTSSAWVGEIPLLPAQLAPPYGALRSIVEMGFALSVGVLFDTFVVRSVLVPSFLSLTAHWRNRTAGVPPGQRKVGPERQPQ